MPESLLEGKHLHRDPSDPLRLPSFPDGDPSDSLRRVTLDQANGSLVSAWQALHDLQSPDMPMTDPEWLRGYFSSQTDAVSVYTLDGADRLKGVAAFFYVGDWCMKWHLGEVTVASLPLRRLRLVGGTPDWPEQEQAYNLLFEELARTPGYDTLYLEEVPIDSYLWKYVNQSELVRKHFLLYQPDPPAPRLYLRLEGSFEQYLLKFSSKHRGELSRRVKKLREGKQGEMRFVRYESPEQVPEFLEHALSISRNTYQWKLHQRGLSETEMVRAQLLYDAEHGWMRSYILFCGDRPCAFRMGSQYRGRFLSHEIGFDPDFARYSVGTVLQYLSIQDLFAYKRPAIFDFQDYGAYKETWATERFLQTKCFLFRRSAYARLCCAGHRTFQAANQTLSSLLERMNWKAELKKRVRGWKQETQGQNNQGQSNKGPVD